MEPFRRTVTIGLHCCFALLDCILTLGDNRVGIANHRRLALPPIIVKSFPAPLNVLYIYFVPRVSANLHAILNNRLAVLVVSTMFGNVRTVERWDNDLISSVQIACIHPSRRSTGQTFFFVNIMVLSGYPCFWVFLVFCLGNLKQLLPSFVLLWSKFLAIPRLLDDQADPFFTNSV